MKLGNYESLLNSLEALSSKLFKLRKVNLSGHNYINDQSVFHLFKNWKFLELAIICNCSQITNVGISYALRERPTLKYLSFSGYFEPEDCVVSPQLKSLKLTSNTGLRDESIKMFSSVFPNFQRLDLTYLYNISEEDICQLLRRSSEIRNLSLVGCLGVKLRGMNFEVPKLEVLNMSNARVDDKALHVISKSCRGLLQLLLEFCEEKHVVKNCIKLREINLRGCDKVHASIVKKMVFSSSSLRKITAPPRYHCNNKESELFSRH